MRRMTQAVFDLIVDRVEGNYAICELPDETMCNIELTYFPEIPKDREWYKAFLDIMGNIRIVEKTVKVIPGEKKHKLSSRLIRFS